MSGRATLNNECTHIDELAQFVGYTRQRLRIFYFNARSLRCKGKIEVIEELITEVGGVDIIIVTESWLEDGDERFVGLTGFSLYVSNRPKGRGGGVAVYTRNELAVCMVKNDSSQEFNILYISVANFF